MEDDQKDMETSKADRSVWLMKCPVIIAKAWNSIPSGSQQTLAKVFVSLDPLHPQEPNSLQFTMEMGGSENVNMPKSYALNMGKDFVPMAVFSESNQGKVASEGKVEHKFDMQPNNKNMEEYSRMCRERTNKSMIKNRQIQVIDNDRGMLMRPLPGMVGLAGSNSKEKRKVAAVKAPEVKRTRRDRGELEDMMFKLFERQPNWTLKQLHLETDQPAQFLKKILNELCTYNKRGTNLGSYELKPEYKKSVEETGAE
ncbi:transcription initiation factor IIF subunit beta-like [Bidens hawaiensis]|uniref:transcription initiation factor IIF subunit beta-like n=1 Tax=Bidens hawaiensis TaxID=980011 RepID=UPI00404B62A5